MFPIRDHTPSQSFPIVNYVLIAINIIAFYIQLNAINFDDFILKHGFIPNQFNPLDLTTYAPILYSMFLHGGFFHIASNLWFLHIFGDNVEDRMGHVQYLIVYLLCGIAAVFSQYFFSQNSSIPMIGASGAISGVTGAYIVFFKHAKIEALIPMGYVMERTLLPSWFFLGYWFVLQVFSGVGSLTSIDQGGVAFFAHIGGFIAGFILAQFFHNKNIEYQ